MDRGGWQKPEVVWQGRVPVSARFDDPYFSAGDGLAEARHVFLGGNRLPGRLCDGFRIAELGFGTGLNLLAVASGWLGPGLVRFTSFEAFPMAVEDMARALADWPELAGLAGELVAHWAAGKRRMVIGSVELVVIEGDARETVAAWEGAADAWFLDGFSPARNPEMWEAGLLAEVARHTAPGGTFATYSAAGAVRARLAEAGFAVERVAGFGSKRHMSRGRRVEA